MRRYMVAVICGCLLIGSFYPKLLLKNHMKLVDESGRKVELQEEFMEDIPLKLEFRILELFR